MLTQNIKVENPYKWKRAAYIIAMVNKFSR